MKKYPYIDSLRGVAILLVMMVHTGVSIPHLSPLAAAVIRHGQLGVQLFFVVSAVTLCLTFEGRSGEADHLAAFYIRRFFRIAPLYWAGIIFYFLLGAAMNHPFSSGFAPQEQYTPLNIAVNWLFLHGFYPPAINNIVPGGWSIGTEMAFYAVFPAIFYAAKKLIGGRKLWLFLLPACALLLNIAAQDYIYRAYNVKDTEFIYFNLINQLPVFMMGISLYFIEVPAVRKRFPVYIDIAGFLVFTLAVTLAWEYRPAYATALIPFLAGLSFVFLYGIFFKIKALNRGWLMKVGQASYSCYLFHFVFAFNMTKLARKILKSFLPPDAILVVCLVMTVLLTYKVAQLSQRYIEQHGIDLGKLLIKRLGRKGVPAHP